jgi:hypothetical protein
VAKRSLNFSTLTAPNFGNIYGRPRSGSKFLLGARCLTVEPHTFCGADDGPLQFPTGDAHLPLLIALCQTHCNQPSAFAHLNAYRSR